MRLVEEEIAMGLGEEEVSIVPEVDTSTLTAPLQQNR
jgi:hypothetical protein